MLFQLNLNGKKNYSMVVVHHLQLRPFVLGALHVRLKVQAAFDFQMEHHCNDMKMLSAESMEKKLIGSFSSPRTLSVSRSWCTTQKGKKPRSISMISKWSISSLWCIELPWSNVLGNGGCMHACPNSAIVCVVVTKWLKGWFKLMAERPLLNFNTVGRYKK